MSPDVPDSHRHTYLQVNVCEQTHVGHVRDHNEDSKYVDPSGRFFVVADGMGGHAAGEVASALAVDEVRKELGARGKELGALAKSSAAPSAPVMTKLLTRAATRANTAVRKLARQDKDKEGMGTTLEVLCLTHDDAWIGHVGDSRTYRVRGTEVKQLTTDHTIAQRFSEDKRVNTPEVLEKWGSVLVEAIGAKDTVNVEVVRAQVELGDRLLMCSDGLYEYFPRTEEIGEILAMEGCKAGLARLVDLALKRGGKDNITGVIVEIASMPNPAGAIAGRESIEGLPRDPEKLSTYSAQDYGIAEAIALMRKLPSEDVNTVVRVMRRTLQSANVALPPIIEDARAKEQRLERTVDGLRSEISGLEGDVAARSEEIVSLEADRAETLMVMERLKMAESMGPISKSKSAAKP